jgi:hypothetical protein
MIAPDGHPKQVAIEPASIDGTPLGDCIKSVFRGTTFPRNSNDQDHQLSVTLRPL